MTNDALIDVALSNAEDAMPDVKLLSMEETKVNGKDFQDVQMEGHIDGIPFRYWGRLYSGNEGTIQFVVMTYPNVFDKYREDIEELLDGITVGG